jgi:N-acetylglucosamine-6-phosphate deacetylase
MVILMATTAVLAGRAFTPSEEISDAIILIEDEKIVAVGRQGEIAIPPAARRLDRRGFTVVPGFVDVHIHGAGGRDVMEATPEALETITGTVARRGTTSLVATTVTASQEHTCTAAKAVSEWMQAAGRGRISGAPQAEILGVHFEGPFISAARRGVHPPEWIVPPSTSAFEQFLAAANGAARILTLAPELPGAGELIVAACRAGVVPSMGHTDATYSEGISAIGHGARHAAHAFNAMRPFAHRDSGVLAAILSSPAVTAELIADGVHVDEGAIRLLLAAKGPRGVILVSDGTAATGMPDGTYRLGTFEVRVSGGVPRSADGKLAGSTLTLDIALRNMVRLGMPLGGAVAMLTANPARLLGVERRKGVLAAGADADLVFLNDRLELSEVMTRGTGLV